MIEKLVVVPGEFFVFGGLDVEGRGDVGVVVADDHGLVAIFFDGLLDGLGLGRGCGQFQILDGFVGLGTGQSAAGHPARHVHVECEFEIYLIVLLVDLEEEVGRRR